MTRKAGDGEEFDSEWRAGLMRGQPGEVILQLGRILEWFNRNDQERTPVERWFWECFQAEQALAAGQRLPTGAPRGLREFKVARDVPFHGRTRVNQLVGELREMVRLSADHLSQERPEGHGLRNRGAASA